MNKSNCFLWLAWILSSVGSLCIIVGLTTPHWRGRTESYEGIFQRCNIETCGSVVLFDGSGEYQLSRGIEPRILIGSTCYFNKILPNSRERELPIATI